MQSFREKVVILCHHKMKIMNFTINIQKNKNGWLTGQCEQIPEAISEGKDMDHLMRNMYDPYTRH